MPLPSSRNTDYTPGSPVKSLDLNDLQDCILGKKFASTPFCFPGGGWQVVSGSATLDANGLWTLGTGAELVRELSLAPGTRITSVVFSLNRNSDPISTGEFQLRLRGRSFGAPPTDLFSDVVSSGSAFQLRDSVAAARNGSPITTVDEVMYWLSVGTSGSFSGSPLFDGAKLACDRL